MIKKLLIVLGLLLFPAISYAHKMNLTWDVVPGASGYVIRHSVDGGVTWVPYTVVPTNVTAYTVPDTGLILIQVGSYNINGRMWRRGSGFFYNGDWKKPVQQTNMGVK